MGSQVSVSRASQARRYLLIGLTVLVVVLVALIVIPSFSRSRESARMVSDELAPASAPAPYAAKMMGGGGGGARGGMGRGGGPSLAADSAPIEAGFEAEEPAPSIRGAALPWPSGPMLIRAASLQMRVDDVATAHEEVARIARAAQGYIAETTFNSESGPASATITIRVPSQGLDSVIDRISKLGKLLSKHISAQEVTEEYVDLSSRRRNLEKEEQRLLELLQRAGKMRDLLEVEQTLARVRGQIEQISGRMRYLENRVSLSTVTVMLEGPQPKPGAGSPTWAASDVVREAARSLLATGRSLATLAIWLGVYSLLWVPFVVLLIWLIRRASPRRLDTPTAGS
jgi:hypothetical protein